MAEALSENNSSEVIEDSLSADLAAAWNAHEEQDNEQAEPDVPNTVHDTDSSPVEQRDTDVDAKTSSRADPAVAAVSGDEKPPVSLSATAREAWKDAPKALKDEIIKRERDFAVGIEQHARDSHRARQMDQALAPFQQYLAVTGEPPAKTIQILLQTASILQMGSPVQRANTVAGLIKQFGVDIRTLDDVLSGQQVREEPRRQVDPEIEELRAFAHQVKQQQQYHANMQNQAVAGEISKFSQDANNEFYQEVSGDMADILDMAAKRNMNMTLQEAYSRACQLHPEVSKILAGRTAAPTQKQRRAASSISGSPGGGGDDSLQGNSVRDAIERAWDMAGRT